MLASQAAGLGAVIAPASLPAPGARGARSGCRKVGPPVESGGPSSAGMDAGAAAGADSPGSGRGGKTAVTVPAAPDTGGATGSGGGATGGGPDPAVRQGKLAP